MPHRLFRNDLFVQPSPLHGYGVFANKAMKAEEVLEECRALLQDEIRSDNAHYVFEMEGRLLLVLGWGSLYNHADQPNVRVYYDENRDLVVFRSMRDIRAGEELFISYRKGWFEARKLKKLPRSWWRTFFNPLRSVYLRAAMVYIVFFTILIALAGYHLS